MIDFILDMTESKYNYNHEGVHNIMKKMSIVKTERRCANFIKFLWKMVECRLKKLLLLSGWKKNGGTEGIFSSEIELKPSLR